MNPSFLVGPVRIYYYGLIIGLAILAAYFFARRRTRQYDWPADAIDTIFLWSIPFGVIGARLYYVIFSWQFFRNEPSLIFSLGQGGLAIHGAVLGGLFGAWLGMRWVRRKHPGLRLVTFLDIAAPTLLLAQIIGRFANFVNQEAFGGPTMLPWGIYIKPERRPPGLESFETFHPTFAYEALWNLMGLVAILMIERRILQKNKQQSGGIIFALYILWYSLGRIWIEALRTDPLLFGPIRVAQLVSLAAIVGAASFIWYRVRQWRHKRPKA